MSSVNNNYQSANKFVKGVELEINKTKSEIRENKSDSLFSMSSSLFQKNIDINQKYEVSGEATTKSVLEDWTAIVELRKDIRTERVVINNEAKKIEERFRQMAGLR